MKTVLIVEDTQDFSDSIKFFLSHKGYNVVTAANGKDGLEQAMRFKPDLILMDVLMPGQDGAETALQVREQRSLRGVPIVFLTALASEKHSKENVIMIHGQAYPAIPKMTDQQEILKRVRHYLEE